MLVRVQPEALERLTQQRGGLQALVAGGVEGLQPADVTVLLDPVVVKAPTPKVEAPASPRLKQMVVALAALCLVMAVLLSLVTLKLRAAAQKVAQAATAVTARRLEPVASGASRPALRAVVAKKAA